MSIANASSARFAAEAEILIVGGGACGLVAALKAADKGAEVVVIERDQSPSGSTSMSSGFIPAPATRFQQALGIEDSAALFAKDIQRKAHGEAEPDLVDLATSTIGPTLEWLADRHGLEWQVLDDFLYPGHSCHRMHTVPERTGEALMARLLAAAEAAGVTVITGAKASTLYVEGRQVRGVGIERPDHSQEAIGCEALILACNGYGANRDLVSQHIPAMAKARYYGHPGNIGDALLWGDALGADLRCLGAGQGHGSLAHPHGILITWALMMEGAIQINTEGKRFSNEHGGYSEQSTAVLAQPGGIAWNIFDARLLDFGRGFPNFRDAEAAGAVICAGDAPALAAALKLPSDALERTLSDVRAVKTGEQADPFGRDFTAKPSLDPPYFAVKVTGALFHTQGGLMIDGTARVIGVDGTVFPNLYAGGGAACGVSGTGIDGYLSGNGLLTAIAFGAIAGDHAASERHP